MAPASITALPCRYVDVCMIVRNEIDIIDRTIEALLAAGFDSFVILDMDSSDSTPARLTALLGDKVRIYGYPAMSLLRYGYAYARNVCATFATRECILFVDADEVLRDGGCVDGAIKIQTGTVATALFSIERHNLARDENKDVDLIFTRSIEHHNRLYMPSLRQNWRGYIHEEIHVDDKSGWRQNGESALVFDHYSELKPVADAESKAGLYALMLLRGTNQPATRAGTNSWHYDVYVPAHLALLEARASAYARQHKINTAFYEAEYENRNALLNAPLTVAIDDLFFETFASADDVQPGLDLTNVRTLHSTAVQPWTGRKDRAYWCEWRHPGEGSRTLTSIIYAFRDCHWERFIRPGATTIDIGGHSGDTAIPLALFSYDKENAVPANTIIVEPNPAVKSVLAVNLSLNTNFARFHLLSAAITGTDVDSIELADHGNSECNGGVLRGGSSEKMEAKLADVAGVRYSARGVSMATLFAETKKISPAPIGFIKIDCEGYDKEIIRPCRDLFSTEKPVLFVEWFAWYEPEDDVDLFAVIAAIDYVPFDPTTLQKASVTTRIFDLICIHRDVLSDYGLKEEI